MKKVAFLLVVALLSLTSMAQAPAFPGAEGVARWTTTGGRGGQVIHVTNLNDSGEGSLRAAVEARGARIVVFDVSGVIPLESTLAVRNSDITILGQTAPGDGICLKNYGFRIATSNVIVRFIRCRMGDAAGNEDDAMNAYFHTGSEASNIIIDHCSVSWCVDECGSFYGIQNFTLQWCVLSESLRYSVHDKGAHGYGGIWGGQNAAFHHNLLAHHDSRNPRFDHDYVSTLKGPIDYVNNVVYNWGSNSTYGGESANATNDYKKINMVGNYYKPGPATNSWVSSRLGQFWDDECSNCSSKMDCSIIVPPHLYVTGNYMYGSDQVTRNNWSGISLHSGASTDVIKSDTRFVPEGYERTTLLSMHSAETAFSKVLSFAGASYKKDAIDQRIAYETEQGVYTYNGSNGSTGGLIDTQGDVGGWPEYASLNPLTDSDQDGMPDVWETANGLNPQDATDAAAYTLDSNQWYTNIEVYANSLVEDLVKAQTADAIEGIDEYYPTTVKVDGVDYYAASSQGGEGGETGGEGISVPATATFAFNLGTNGQTAMFDEESAGYFLNSKVTYGANLTLKDQYTIGETVQTRFQPSVQDSKASEDNAICFLIQPQFGYKFTPTKVSFKSTRYGTDGGLLDIAWLQADNTTITLDTGVSPARNSKEPNISELSYTVYGATAVEGVCGLVVNLYSLGNTKQVGFSDIVIEGMLTGQAKEVPVLGSFKINGKEYTADDIFGSQYEATIELSGSELMVSSRNPLTDVTATIGEIGNVNYELANNQCVVTIPMTAGNTTLSYVLTIVTKPQYTLTYYNTDGTVMGTQQVEKDAAIGTFAIDSQRATAPEGMAVRGWFKKASGGEKFTTDYVITGNMSLYAVATEIETASMSKKYTFNLGDPNFDANDHEAFNPTGGAWHDSQHGWSFSAGDKIQLLVGPKATISFTTCQFAKGTLNINGVSLNVQATTDGEVVTYTHDGEPGILTFEVEGGIYLHAVKIANTSETNYTAQGQWYLVKAGDASSFLDVLDVVNGTNASATASRAFIFLPNGTYDLGTACLTPISGHNISIIGESQQGVIVKNLPEQEGIAVTATLMNTGSNNYLQDLTIQNSWDYYGKIAEGSNAGRAVCLWDKGTNTICKNVTLLSYQDTYYTNNNNGQYYWETSDIHGTVDFICGGGTLFMENSTITVEMRNPLSINNGKGECTITAPYTAIGMNYGYVFNNCRIDNYASSYNLGRAWGGEPRCAFLNTTVNDNLMSRNRYTTAGMNVAAKEFVEYNTMDATGNVVSPASNVLTFTHTSGDYTYETILTEAQAANYMVEKVFANWQPAVLAAQAAAPKAAYADGVITWTADGAVAIYKNGVLVDIVTEGNTYAVDADVQSDVLTMRAANAMGGFGDAVVVETKTEPEVLMGDVDGSGQVNVTDVVLTIDYILEKNPSNFNVAVADVNKDGGISVTDVVMIIDNILGKINLNRAQADAGVVGSIALSSPNTIALNNPTAYTAFQMDVTLPMGVTLKKAQLTDRSNGHLVSVSQTGEGRYRIVGISLQNEAFEGTMGDLLRLQLDGDSHGMTIDNVLFATPQGVQHELAGIAGDATSISDVRGKMEEVRGDAFNLKGQRITNPNKGLYIVNGKKMMIDKR